MQTNVDRAIYSTEKWLGNGVSCLWIRGKTVSTALSLLSDSILACLCLGEPVLFWPMRYVKTPISFSFSSFCSFSFPLFFQNQYGTYCMPCETELTRARITMYSTAVFFVYHIIRQQAGEGRSFRPVVEPAGGTQPIQSFHAPWVCKSSPVSVWLWREGRFFNQHTPEQCNILYKRSSTSFMTPNPDHLVYTIFSVFSAYSILSPFHDGKSWRGFDHSSTDQTFVKLRSTTRWYCTLCQNRPYPRKHETARRERISPLWFCIPFFSSFTSNKTKIVKKMNPKKKKLVHSHSASNPFSLTMTHAMSRAMPPRTINTGAVAAPVALRHGHAARLTHRVTVRPSALTSQWTGGAKRDKTTLATTRNDRQTNAVAPAPGTNGRASGPCHPPEESRRPWNDPPYMWRYVFAMHSLSR